LPRATPRQRLAASTEALVSVLRFLDTQEQFQDLAPVAPLNDLLDQLASVAIGGHARMLQLKTVLKTPHTPARAALDASAAAAVDALRREGMSLKEACTSVSQWMPLKVRQTPKHLKEKRKEFREGSPALGIERYWEAALIYQQMLKRPNGHALLKERFSLLAESLTF
jgi:hypothetical protein